MNLWNVLNWANAILLEGFKDDILSGYKKLGYDTENKKLWTAIKTLNSENEIKELIKREVGKVPNVGLAVAKKYTPEEFIGVVSKSKRELNAKRRKQKEAQARVEAASSASDDYYIYPCRTFEEAHEAAFAHTGNLKRLSREDRERFFKEEYDIDIPRPATHYQTDMTPAQMLDFMKECPVFMEPTWCVCADKKYWNNYKLKATKKEAANCFVVISKTHPNVRFCITRDVVYQRHRQLVEGDGFMTIKYLGEFRDIWQIGGSDEYVTGVRMATLAFGSVEDILKNISEDAQKFSFDVLENGHGLYKNANDIGEVDTNFAHLFNGYEMYQYSSITRFTANVPQLTTATNMFGRCRRLKEVVTDFPSLEEATSMFIECPNLEVFSGKMPKLEEGNYCFCSCSKLKKFSTDISSLQIGDGMFCDCPELKEFNSSLPNLTTGVMMFASCKKLKSFNVPLPSLKWGGAMFSNCKLDKPSVINILTSIPYNLRSGRISIGTGYDYTKDKDTLQAIEDAENKGWDVEIRDNTIELL